MDVKQKNIHANISTPSDDKKNVTSLFNIFLFILGYDYINIQSMITMLLSIRNKDIIKRGKSLPL